MYLAKCEKNNYCLVKHLSVILLQIKGSAEQIINSYHILREQ